GEEGRGDLHGGRAVRARREVLQEPERAGVRGVGQPRLRAGLVRVVKAAWWESEGEEMTRVQIVETYEALRAKGYEAVHARGKGGGFWIRKDGKNEYVSDNRAREIAGRAPLA